MRSAVESPCSSPPHRLLLIRHPHRAKAALADFLEQLVRPDALTRLLRLEPRELCFDFGRKWRVLCEKAASLLVRRAHPVYVLLQFRIVTALLVDEVRALGHGTLQRGVEGRLSPRRTLRGKRRWTWRHRRPRRLP